MATIIIPSDAFQESAKRDFIESPHYERGGPAESGIGFACTFDLKRSLTVGLTRNGWEPGGPVVAARTALSSTLMRWTFYSFNVSDSSWRQIVQEKFKDGSADSYVVTGTDPFVNDPATYSVTTLLTDTDSEVQYKVEWFDASDVLVWYQVATFDQPWTHAEFVAECQAIWDSKVGAWEISTSRTSEYWEYISGTLVSSYDVIYGAAIIASPQGGSGYYANVLWGIQITGGQYYFYMPLLVSGLLCKMRLTLLDYGSECTFTYPGGAGSSVANAITYGLNDGYTDPIAGTDGTTIATKLPAVDIYPYAFADHEYHQRAFKGNPITQ